MQTQSTYSKHITSVSSYAIVILHYLSLCDEVMSQLLLQHSDSNAQATFVTT